MIEKAKAVGVLSGSAISTKLQIFQDTIFFYLAIFGAIVSFFGLLHDILEKKEFIGWKRATAEGLRAILFGFLLTPLIFLILLNGGNTIIAKFWDIDLNMTASVYLIISIVLSWYAIPIWDLLVQKLFRRLKENDK